MKIPESGRSWESLDSEMDHARSGDADWRHGRIGVYIHYAGEDVLDVAKRAYLKFFSENGLGPAAFPSLAKFEAEIIEMTLGLLNAPAGARGTMTTGGTESIFLAVKSARDRALARHPGLKRPRIVVPQSAHPAFSKAAHFMGIELVRTPIGADFRADVDAAEAACTDETILLVGSAPAFPHGIIDPIEELGAVAEKRDLWFHVDACVGGYIAPFARLLGVPLPNFDFTVPAVTSVSADLHKYGYAAKGASTVLYRDEPSFSYQAYAFEDWPRGRYFTQTLVGTRAGGAIAAAWAVMNYLGMEGYLDRTQRILRTRRALSAGVTGLGLSIWGDPALSILSFGSRIDNMRAVAAAMSEFGWYVGQVVEPPGLHLMLNLTHETIVDEYLHDLSRALTTSRSTRSVTEHAPITY